MDPTTKASEGDVLDGRYRLGAVIGRGGMGEVFAAEQINLGRRVAVKVLPANLDDRASEYEARFRREALAASRLQHPNIVQIVDYGRDPRFGLYLAMEYLDGRSFAEIMAQEQPLGPQRIADLLTQALAALEAAHGAQILHRDIKPANIMACNVPGRPDFVKVLDFGIARALDGGLDNLKLTQAGTVCGTPTHMAPEQAMGRALDGRADLYAVGTILYEMVTGSLPFDEPNPMDYLVRKVNEDPPAPARTAVGAPVPPEVAAVCLRALARRPEERFRDAAEFRRALEPWIRPVTPGAASSRATPSPPGAAPAAEANPLAGWIDDDAALAPTPRDGSRHVGPATPEETTADAPQLVIEDPDADDVVKMVGDTWEELMRQTAPGAPAMGAAHPAEPAAGASPPGDASDADDGSYPRFGPRIVGRDALLGELGVAMDRAESDGWGSWVLYGPKGAGRSRLVVAAANQAGAAGWEVQVIRPTAPGLSPFLVPGDLMQAPPGTGPRLVIVDDLDLLPEVLQTAFFDDGLYRDRPTLVLGTALGPTGVHAGTHRRQLAPLTLGERQALAMDLLGERPPLDGPEINFPAWLLHRTYLDVETHRLSRAGRSLWSYGSHRPSGAEHADALIQQRVTMLDPQAQRLLRLLALAPFGADQDGITRVTTAGTTPEDALDPLVDAALVERVDRRWLVASRSIGEVVRAAVLPNERARLHAELAAVCAHAARYARGVRRRQLMLQEASHREMAGEDSDAGALLERIAELMMAIEQPARAIGPLRRAIALVHGEVGWTTVKIRMTTRLADALTDVGSPDKALEELAPIRIRQRLGRQYPAMVALSRARALVAAGDAGRAEALEEAARLSGETDDSQLQIRARIALASAALKRRDRPAARRHAEQALGTLRLGDLSSEPTCDALFHVARVLARCGDKEGAEARYRELLEHARQHGVDHMVARGRLGLASLMIERGDPRGAARHIDDVRADADVEPVIKARACLNRGLLYTILRDAEGARECHQEALSHACAAGWFEGALQAARSLGR